MADKRGTEHITVEDYYTLLWWVTKGLMAIRHGEGNPSEIATKYLDGIATLLKGIEDREPPQGLLGKIKKGLENVTGSARKK